jgi:hypothetical protein
METRKSGEFLRKPAAGLSVAHDLPLPEAIVFGFLWKRFLVSDCSDFESAHYAVCSMAVHRKLEMYGVRLLLQTVQCSLELS